MAEQQLIHGIHAVSAALEHQPGRVTALWMSRDRRDRRLTNIRELARKAGIRVQELGRDELDGKASGQRHQGVIASVEGARAGNEQSLPALLDGLDASPFLLILDGVTDPHNLGACLRSADAAGIQAVITPKDKSAGLTPVASKVACGAAETVPFIQVTNLARTMKDLQQRGIWLVGLAGEGEQTIYDADMKGPLALVMGAEGQGLRRLTRETCDFLVRIPMQGSVESLNVSVATGIVLFEALRQRS
jgi:23S rRNA (guanosine2251-2'-O)-methyltransferase